MQTCSKPLSALVLATILASGAGLAWAVAVSLGLGPWLSHARRSTGEYLEIRFDGTPIVASYAFGDDGDTETTFRTLDGERIEYADTRKKPKDFVESVWLAKSFRSDERFAKVDWDRRLTRLGHGDRNNEQISKKMRKAKWYFVHDGLLHGHGYFANCGAEPGYLGLKGFRLNKPPVEEQFPVDGRRFRSGTGPLLMPGSSSVSDSELQFAYSDTSEVNASAFSTPYLLTDEGLAQIDLEDGTVKLLQKEDILSASSMFKYFADVNRHHGKIPDDTLMLIRTPDRVRVVDFYGEQQASYLLPAELRERDFTWRQLPDGEVVVQITTPPQGQETSELFWINRAGEITRREKVNLKVPPLSTTIVDDIGTSLAVPSPTVLLGLLVCDSGDDGLANRTRLLGFRQAFWEAMTKIWRPLLITIVISIVLAVVCYRRQRRFGLPATWMWTMFVLFFGLPAYFGYLVHRQWPARLACPNCGQRVPRDRPACFACGHDFPAPALKGIEVFA